jgi:glycosyltransferase involved in cell wall biosynthesis
VSLRRKPHSTGKLKILFLSRKMDEYKAASYQLEVMQEIQRQADVKFYGPGFPAFREDGTINDILRELESSPDLILVGHSWLGDNEKSAVDPMPRLGLEACSIPKAIIINKEYVNLAKKLTYVRSKGFLVAFSHHHEVERYSRETRVEFTFWPFGYASDRYHFGESDRVIDLGFSGLLQNSNAGANQTDIRARIQKNVFFSILDIPLKRKPMYRGYNIYWNSISRSAVGRHLGTVVGKRRWLEPEEYANLLRDTKVFINTPSPVDLVSPRVLECMASGAVVFCQESEQFKRMFPSNTYVAFATDLSDFDRKLTKLIVNIKLREQITKNAREFVTPAHSWEVRVKTLLDIVTKRLVKQ